MLAQYRAYLFIGWDIWCGDVEYIFLAPDNGHSDDERRRVTKMLFFGTIEHNDIRISSPTGGSLYELSAATNTFAAY